VWLVVATLSVSTLGSAGVVLCVDESGHVAIESAAAEDCCRDSDQRTRELSHAGTCGCTDTPVLHAAAATSTGTERLVVSWVAQPLALFAPPIAEHVSVSNPSRRDSVERCWKSTDLSNLRSVVLLA